MCVLGLVWFDFRDGEGLKVFNHCLGFVNLVLNW